jgi:hypothetical protein
VHLQLNICSEQGDAAMMFPDTSNAQPSAALREQPGQLAACRLDRCLPWVVASS